ncbi:sensor histidine kinase [Paludisphaera soli]|uniref:sensor histidine kinase n=1 Tax=Paludisphaera soli TaxID=2712865 RepID=UPI0013EAE62C|nr:ATP-binding protein [Paludisphaera soli]
MRSIYAKLLAWAAVTVALSSIGFVATFWYLSESRSSEHRFIDAILALQRDGAVLALRDGGREGLRAFLAEMGASFEGDHFLVDRHGRDLLDGSDRAGLLARARRPESGPRPPRPPGGPPPVMLSPPTADGVRFIALPRPRFVWSQTLPYYLWILLLILALIYALAVHLVRPLRRLQRALDEFGRGGLATRIGSNRRDEIGDLARSFDVMADRIASLMAAERRLIQDVSHELRSPLTRLGLAVRLGRSGDREAAMGRIKKEVDRLSALVDELLRLNSAEEDPHARHRDEFRLGELLADLADDCAVEAEAKGCRIDMRADAPAVATGDRELIRRAVENVLRNAVRHAPEGSAVEVALRADADAATIAVRDRGPGVPEGSLEDIFKPFFRIEDDRSRASGGVGLGLAIARRAVALHGGSILAADADPGLLVTIRLPRAPGPGDEGSGDDARNSPDPSGDPGPTA